MKLFLAAIFLSLLIVACNEQSVEPTVIGGYGSIDLMSAPPIDSTVVGRPLPYPDPDIPPAPHTVTFYMDWPDSLSAYTEQTMYLSGGKMILSNFYGWMTVTPFHFFPMLPGDNRGLVLSGTVTVRCMIERNINNNGRCYMHILCNNVDACNPIWLPPYPPGAPYRFSNSVYQIRLTFDNVRYAYSPV